MLIFAIDAFNLIHAVPELADSAAPRADLVAFLKAAKLEGSATNRVVLFFDGYPAEGVDQERLYDVVFSKNRTADDEIREYVEKAAHPRQIVVVSDDHAVRDTARAQGATPMKNEEFLRRGQKHAKAALHDAEPIDDDRRERITKELESIWIKK